MPRFSIDRHALVNKQEIYVYKSGATDINWLNSLKVTNPPKRCRRVPWIELIHIISRAILSPKPFLEAGLQLIVYLWRVCVWCLLWCLHSECELMHKSINKHKI